MKHFKLFFTTLVLIALFVSFYRLSDFYHLDFDQERDYQVAAGLVSGEKFTLIGPRAVSSAGFYLGPWYYYLLTPFYFLSMGHPLYAAVAAGMVNFVTTLVLFSFLKKHTTSLIAFAVSIVWLSVLHRTAWNVMFVPLFVIGILHFLTLKRQTPLSLAALLFLVSLGVHFHFQVILFLPLAAIFFFFNRETLPRLSIKLVFFCLLALLIPLLPLVVFDLRHEFLNTNAFFHFFAGKLTNTSSYDYLTLLKFSFRNLIREIGLFTPWPLSADYYLLPPIYLALLYNFFRTNRRFFIISLFPLISLLALSFYSPPDWPEYYHLSASLIFLIFLGIGVSSNHALTKVFTFLALVGLFLTLRILLVAPTDPFAYSHKEAAMRYILDQTKPHRPNIEHEFKYGEGLGFLPIRQYYEKEFNPEYDLTKSFLLSFPDNPKHNQSAQFFGAFAVSTFTQ